MTPPIVVAPPPPPPTEPAPWWFTTLTRSQRWALTNWLRVRKVDTTSWPK